MKSLVHTPSQLAANSDVRFAVGVMTTSTSVTRWLVGSILSAFGLAWLLRTTTKSMDLAVGVAGVALVVGFVGSSFAARNAQFAVVKQEMARLARHPFGIAGFFDTLAAAPQASCVIRVTVVFGSDVLPESTLLRDLLGLVAADEVAELRLHRTVVIASKELDCSQTDGPDTNRAVYLWQSKALRGVLVPLHEAFPIATVAFLREG